MPVRAAAVLVLGVAGSALAQASFVGLGTFQTPSGVGRPQANRISADGATVVGCLEFASGIDPAFRWTASAGLQSVGGAFGADLTAAHGVSADGSVMAGFTGGAENRAFRWESGAFTELLPLGGDDAAYAIGVSDDGLAVAGASRSMTRGYRVVRWDASGTVEDLGVVPGDFQSVALNMSGDGRTIVGWSDGSGYRPFRWTADRGMELIPLAPGNGGWAFGASTDGSTIVGGTYGPDGHRAFRWTELTGPQYLALLPGATEAIASAVSADGGVVVGTCGFGPSERRAFLWTPALGTVDLNEHMRALGVNLTGWELAYALGISADGSTILGLGLHNGEYEPWVAVIVCYPDCNTSGSLTVADFGCFQTRFVGGDRYADCDADGALTVADFGCFQTTFETGCP